MCVSRGALMIGMLALSAVAFAQDEIEKDQRKLPKDSDAYALVDGPMSKLFDTFQAPIDMFVADADSKTPAVCFDYGPFGYIVRDKQVRTCIFWPEWKDTVFGIHLGDTSDKVMEKLGKPGVKTHEAAGPEHMLWNVKEKDRQLELMLDFDKDKKLERAVVRPGK